jgi:hypothetical protein
VCSLAEDQDAAAMLFRGIPDPERGTTPSEWVLVARDADLLAPFDAAPSRREWGPERPEAWNDDFSSLLGLLR